MRTKRLDGSFYGTIQFDGKRRCAGGVKRDRCALCELSSELVLDLGQFYCVLYAALAGSKEERSSVVFSNRNTILVKPELPC